MAEKKKMLYPMLAKKNWFALRNKFKEIYPKVVTNIYLSTVLDMDKDSAQANVMPYLKIIGLVDEEGNTTELANKWRVDDKYAEVCKEIKEKVYPKELLDAVPDPATNQKAAISWFMTTTKKGSAIASKMTAFYTLVSRADLAMEKEISVPSVKEKKAKPAKGKIRGEKRLEGKGVTGIPEGEKPKFPQIPIHIDLQIHLSPEAKPEQIDKIFESMAKHLKEFYNPQKSK